MKKILNEILRFNNVYVPPLLRLAGHGNEEIFGFRIQVTEDVIALWENCAVYVTLLDIGRFSWVARRTFCA